VPAAKNCSITVRTGVWGASHPISLHGRVTNRDMSIAVAHTGTAKFNGMPVNVRKMSTLLGERVRVRARLPWACLFPGFGPNRLPLWNLPGGETLERCRSCSALSVHRSTFLCRSMHLHQQHHFLRDKQQAVLLRIKRQPRVIETAQLPHHRDLSSVNAARQR